MPVAANDARMQRVAFAHLVGNGIDYLVKKYEITLGRKAKNYTPDVIMGETMSVSRQHAKIIFNFDTNQFELIVLGRNGVMVDGSLYEPEYGPVPLRSKALLQIGDTSFYFLLPKKLSKLFPSSETEIAAAAAGKGSKPNNAENGKEATFESGEATGAGSAAAADATAAPIPSTGAMPTQQQMIRLIQEAAARQHHQHVIAASLTAQQQQQEQQQRGLSPAQHMLRLQQDQQQQQRQQLAGEGGAGATLSPQQLQLQQMRIQMLLQQQQFINQQQQKSPPN
ncbi:hypothetical protein Ndes2526B_g05250 [Nannochloris sp. 'desiccata']|nr:hypothetical protein KSW81_000166 [Chlorella desiccata (nom. nud.)]KAH7620002.1 putative Transcriptional activator FHA1 [Chlorella desiccata (nom. nud.)]